MKSTPTRSTSRDISSLQFLIYKLYTRKWTLSTRYVGHVFYNTLFPHCERSCLAYYCYYLIGNNMRWVIVLSSARLHSGLMSSHFCWTLASVSLMSPKCVILVIISWFRCCHISCHIQLNFIGISSFWKLMGWQLISWELIFMGRDLVVKTFGHAHWKNWSCILKLKDLVM